MTRYILVYHLDAPDTVPALATVQAGGAITGAANRALADTIRDAIRDPMTTLYTPDHRMVLGPAIRHDPATLDWAALVCVGLACRGLRGVPIGYPQPPAPWGEDPPGLVY